MNGIVAENGKVVTDEMIADWESALERDEWPSGWVNVGEIVEGKLPKAAPDTVTLSLKVPAAMKRALEKEAKAEGKSTGTTNGMFPPYKNTKTEPVLSINNAITRQPVDSILPQSVQIDPLEMILMKVSMIRRTLFE